MTMDLASLADRVVEAAHPRIVRRGEAYDRGGAVRRLITLDGGIRGEVEGSAAEPYQVSVADGPAGIVAVCSCPYDWTDVCKHAVALALAAATGGGPRDPHGARGERPVEPADVGVDPDDAIAEAIEREREARRQSAREESFRMLRPGTNGDGGPKARGGGLRRVRSDRTGAVYEVLLVPDGRGWCSCPDLRTNELGTCKHLEWAAARRTRRGAAAGARAFAVLDAADSRGRLVDPLRDVRLVLPERGLDAVRRLVDAEGFVVPRRLGPASGRVAELRRRLARARGLVVRPEVAAHLDALEEDRRWTRRFAAFTRQVRLARAGRGRPPAPWSELEADLRYGLHDYQVDGVLFAARVRRALLADDMGLGKTLQAIAAIRLLIALGEVERAVVVCPASLKRQWVAEVAKFVGPALEAVVVEGGRSAREAIYRGSRAPMLVVNYELVVRDLPELRALAPDLVVLDEAQRIKNWNTKTAKAVKAIPAPRTLVLTGTPLENRLAELHSIGEHLDPRVLGPMWRLGPEFAETVREKGERPRVIGFRGLDLVRRRLAPRLLRRERAAVLDQLPERVDQWRPVPLTQQQRDHHADHAQNAARIAAKRHLSQADVLRLMAELTNMRLIANGMLLYRWEAAEPGLRGGRLPAKLREQHPSPKLDELGHVLEDLLGQRGTRVVVFSAWERMLRLSAAAVRPVLDAAGVHPLFFHGGLSTRERAEAVADFHEDPGSRVLFSTDAGGVGLNLQDAASTVVQLDVPWNPAVIEQRVGRVHRMGQRRSVQVVTLVASGSIEERITELVAHKRALFEGLLVHGTDEVRFDDESRGTLAERIRDVLGTGEGSGPKPTAPGEASVLAKPRAIDEETVLVKTGRAAWDPTGTAAPGTAAAAPPATPTVTADPTEVRLDAGAMARGLAGLLGMPLPEGQAAPMPVTIRRGGDGRVAVELPPVPEEAWEHLQRFVTALGAPPVTADRAGE